LPKTKAGTTIRPLRATDDMQVLTELLHRAYGALAARGWHFVASHQSVDVTIARCAKGDTFVAVFNDSIVGTITIATTRNTGGSPWLDRDDVASFGQFAVEPDLQKLGIGDKLLDAVEHRALELGIAELALDTCEEAEHLIRYYSSRGYRFIEKVKWTEVNYGSVVMSKTLTARTSPEDGI
jgi:GNAT superfamily N-acetyltransferase